MTDLVQWVDDWLVCTDPFNPGACGGFLATGMGDQTVNNTDYTVGTLGGTVGASVNDLLAHWAFETTGPGADQTPDSLGVHPADLYPGSGQPVLGPVGAIGNAMQLDALGEHAIAQDPTGGLSVGNGDCTIAIWFRHDGASLGGGETIYIEKLGGGAGYTIYSRDAESGGTNGLVRLYMQGGAGEIVWDAAFDGLTLNDGAWHHMAITKQANAGAGQDEWLCYIDGATIQAAGQAAGVHLHTTGLNTVLDEVSSDVWMGARNPAIWGQNFQINGALDEAHIYDVVLSPSEVTYLVNPGPMVTIVEEGGTTVVTEGGETDSYTVVLTQAPSGGDAAVSINTDDDVDVNPAILTFTDLNWDQERTVTVSAVNDLLSEGPETSTITHTVTGGGYDGVDVRDILASVIDNEEYCGQLGTIFSVSDLNLDCYVNMRDFEILASEWLECTDPGYPDDCYEELLY